MTNPRYGPYSITAIIKQIKFNEYSLEKLLEILLNDPDYNKILYLYIKKNILLSGCKLNKYILDSRANNNKVWGVNEIRGGKPYYPPHGWVGYGLRVADRFDNGDNSWLDYNHSKGEWSVAYIGIGEDLGQNKLMNNKNKNDSSESIRKDFKNFNDKFHSGQKVGEGIIVTPKPKVLEKNCGIFTCCGTKYKIGFMTRVNPEKIRCPEGQDDYWVINGTDNEIRPYRILIKEI